MGINIRDWPMILYVFLIAGPTALAVVSVYESLDWAFGKFDRDVPKAVERACRDIVDVVLIPLPDVTDAIPEESA